MSTSQIVLKYGCRSNNLHVVLELCREYNQFIPNKASMACLHIGVSASHLEDEDIVQRLIASDVSNYHMKIKNF